jgi:hypothetical protein
MSDSNFAVAYRISDEIVEILNREDAKGCDNSQRVIGLLLAFKSMQRTFPPDAILPAPLRELGEAVNRCLATLVNFAEWKQAHPEQHAQIRAEAQALARQFGLAGPKRGQTS